MGSSFLTFSLGFALCAGFVPVAMSAQAQLPPPGGIPARGYFRQPALRGDTLCFVAEGDLWILNLAGKGPARRLTTHVGEESRPALSPDGTSVAFTATYEGGREVYVLPVSGGLPRRLSFEGERSLVVGWTPQGEVLFSTQNPTGPARQRVIAAVHPGSLVRRVLPLADAHEGCLDATGRVLFFTRLGLQLTGDNARPYRGGAASELWRFELDGQGEARKLPLDAPGRSPMWHEGRLYFLSDRSGTENLWSVKEDGSDLRQHTQHSEWDVRGPSLGEGRIVYQVGADLRLLDLTSGTDRLLSIELVSDFDQQRERVLRRPLDYLDSVRLAPKGDRVVLTARGQVALGALQQVRRVDLRLPDASRAREAVLSPDGRRVFAFCDAPLGPGQPRENGLWSFPADGSAGAKALGKPLQGHPQELLPSPDGAHLAYTLRNGELWLHTLASGESRCIDRCPSGHEGLVWSADSKVLALVKSPKGRGRNQIVLYALEGGRQVPITSDRYLSRDPAFTPDGQWLYFLSDRNFQLGNGGPWGDRNTGPVFEKRTRLYALALQKGLRFPFQPKDELEEGTPKEEAKAKEKDEPKGRKAPAALQWEGLETRLFEVPVAAGSYRDLRTDGRRLYFLERENQGRRATLRTLELAPGASPETFASDLRSFELSQEGKKVMLVKASERGAGEILLVDAGAKLGDVSKAQVNLGDWCLTLDPRQEWRQMFGDAWRMHRDFLFDPRMRGRDWAALRRKFEPLVERVTDRAELDDLIGQMVSHLGALHSQVRGGEYRQAQDGSIQAFLGGVFERQADGYRITRIYRADPEQPSEVSPLARPGLEIREGDVITHLNGRSVLEVRDLSDLLRNRAGQQVLLSLKRGAESLKPQVVVPVEAERNGSLRYGDWEEACRLKAEKASQGAIGYLHLRSMVGSDMNAFVREFYANIHRQGLIIDVRSNGGGNIDSWILEKLLRRPWAFWASREGHLTEVNMQQAFRGHLAVLIDPYTYSDGETFAAGFRALGLGPLVGRRTSGAGVWLSDDNTLVDRGMARAAETNQFDARSGQWLIEGRGVAPDVEVDNLPFESYQGRDRQLETALQLLQEKINKEPLPILKSTPIPPLP